MVSSAAGEILESAIFISYILRIIFNYTGIMYDVVFTCIEEYIIYKEEEVSVTYFFLEWF